MKPMKIWTASFSAGCLFFSALLCFIQDMLGMEGYLLYAREHWVSARFSIPFEIFSLIFLFWFIRMVNKYESEQSQNLVKADMRVESYKTQLSLLTQKWMEEKVEMKDRCLQCNINEANNYKGDG